MSFTKATLEAAMNDLAKTGKIFSNESQFQFDLAWKLREMGYEVELEVLSANCNPSQFAALPKEEKKKYYTDIVIKDDNEYIAIELKYKTPDNGVMQYKTGSGNYYVFPQGAENISSYLYWKDVERLEELVFSKILLNFNASKKVSRGYAVLLTNDCKYWNPSKYNYRSIARDFLPIRGKKLGALHWHFAKGGVDVSRGEINLKKEYDCNWNNYDCKYSSDFKYIILEV